MTPCHLDTGDAHVVAALQTAAVGEVGMVGPPTADERQGGRVERQQHEQQDRDDADDPDGQRVALAERLHAPPPHAGDDFTGIDAGSVEPAVPPSSRSQSQKLKNEP